MLLSLLSLALADEPDDGPHIGPVPVAAISDEVFWSHVIFTPALRAPDGMQLHQARLDVPGGRVGLQLTHDGEPVTVDWAASSFQVAGESVGVTYTPVKKRRTLATSPLSAEAEIRGIVRRADGAPLMRRLELSEAPPVVTLQLDSDQTAAILFGVAFDNDLIPAHCADMEKRRRESWLNLGGAVALTGGLTLTALRIYGEEREVLGTTIPTLPTGGLLALSAASAATAGVMGARVGRSHRALAVQCPE